ncbi:MAG: hypothetical protein O7C03_04870 [Gammaproteobacteria bacterium]|nr:hypothetical protein [Gammaproteobacteria bacterium]MCZ6762316.1 hypothetical protein [Gammaproteobacteria bacterium]
MEISNEHNLAEQRGLPRPFGIKVTLNREDPFRNLVDEGWEKFLWYASAEQRDAAFEDMRSTHRYSRRGDRPSLVYDKVDKSG